MRPSRDSSYFIRSSFQLAYFVILLIAIVQMASTLIAGTNPVQIEIDQASKVISRELPDLLLVEGILNILKASVWFFVLVFSMHLVRIYVTLEFMEDGEWLYKDFYNDFNWIGRIIDFSIRSVIIIVVSLKVLKVDGFASFPIYVVAFYASTGLWTINACICGGKGRRESFANSSMAGGVIATAILIASNLGSAYGWQILAIVFTIGSVVLFVDMSRFLGRNWGGLVEAYRMKFIAPW